MRRPQRMPPPAAPAKEQQEASSGLEDSCGPWEAQHTDDEGPIERHSDQEHEEQQEAEPGPSSRSSEQGRAGHGQPRGTSRGNARSPARSSHPSSPRTGTGRSSPSRGASPHDDKYALPKVHKQPKAKPPAPKQRHTLDNVDPNFIATASVAVVEKPGLGRVYDWNTHHGVNEALSKQKREQQRAVDLIAAARLELAYRSESERAFQQWLDIKAQERKLVTHERKRVLQLASLPVVQREPQPVLAKKERGWNEGFGSPATIHEETMLQRLMDRAQKHVKPPVTVQQQHEQQQQAQQQQQSQKL